jgi:hypothetical protein
MKELAYLLATYFHEDWNSVHTTWQAVVDDFAADDPATVAAVPDEIDRLLRSTSDQDLGAVLLDMGCAYAPREGDRAWLRAVGDRIRAHLDEASVG